MSVQESTLLDENSMAPENQNEVSDPLKHLLSLDWEQAIDLSKPKTREKDILQSKTAKKVRFSEEINEFPCGNSDVGTLHVSSAVKVKAKNIDSSIDCSKKTSSLLLDSNDSISAVNENNADNSSDFNEKMDLIKSFSEIFIDPNSLVNNVITETEKHGTEHGNSNSLLSKNSFYQGNTMVSKIIDPDNLVEQIERLSISSTEEKESSLEDLLPKKDSLASSHAITEPHSISEIPKENTLIQERKQVIVQNKKTKQKVSVLKQTGKLNSLLKTDSEFTKASELKSSVYDAWSKVKKETKSELPTFSSNKRDPLFVQKPAARYAFLLWKKTAIKTMKSTRRAPNKNKNPNDINQKAVKSDDNESQMAYLSWKKSKDEVLKQQTNEKLRIERQQRLAKLRNEEEKRKESVSAFVAWKNHKANIFKFRQLQKNWMMEKKKGAAEQKTERDKEALQMYNLWLDSKQSSSVQRTDVEEEMKPPWYPPGKS